MPIDARLGFRNSSGVITTLPTKYADGSGFNVGDFYKATRYHFSQTTETYFTALPSSVQRLEQINSGLEAELLALTGATSSIGSLNNIRSTLDLTPIPPISVFYDFEGATVNTDTWTVNVNGTASVAGQPNTTGLSLFTLTTGTSDNGHATLTSDLTYLSSSKATLIEIRLKVDDVAEVGIEFGFSDATSETAGMAFSSLTSPTAVATNAVTFGYLNDTGGNEIGTGWRAMRVRAGTAAGTLLTGPVPPVANTWVELAVALALNANQVDATYFLNGDVVATATNVVAVNTPLYIWVTAKTFEASDSKSVDIDYLRISQSR